MYDRISYKPMYNQETTAISYIITGEHFPQKDVVKSLKSKGNVNLIQGRDQGRKEERE